MKTKMYHDMAIKDLYRDTFSQNQPLNSDSARLTIIIMVFIRLFVILMSLDILFIHKNYHD